ncbi:MAG TPA: hypothetical protein VFX45_11560 [Solirubrobacterales bacterium]|nr:hypothetical protein [Solirubrobacterales bacterium]
MRCVPAILTALALTALAAGCGGEGGVSEGATVTVYVDARLCAGAEQALAEAGGEAGDLRVKAICLPGAAPGESALARIGVNARRATQDSTAVAVIEPGDDRTVTRFSEPILDSASIPLIAASSGAAAMRQILSAISEAGSGSLRDAVADSVDASS